MKRIIGLGILLVLSWTCAAQDKRFNVWYFGERGGLDFNATPPGPRTNGAINVSNSEGTASICDESGTLRFYTNGINVWSRNHALMPNSGGLGGHLSSTQGALIVPRPGARDLYYVFSTPNQGQGPLQWAEVNLALNGGLGAVGTRNQVLLAKATEKLQGIPHCNGTDYWVLAHEADSDKFVSYLVTAAGVSAQPVESRVGARVASATPADRLNAESIGQLKASQNGSRLAAAISGQNAVELYDFNPATGVVSNPVRLTGAFSSKVYGVEFSPSGRFLYLGGSLDDPNTSSEKRDLYQLDLTKGSAADIAASAQLIGQSPSQVYGAFQMGTDGKIYLANNNDDSNASNRGYPALGVINRPDEPGAGCQYAPEGIPLDGGKSALGLPNLLAGVCRKLPEVVCQKVQGGACGGGLLKAIVTNASNVTYQWYREGVTIPGATGETYRPLIAGKFSVKIAETTPCPLRAESAEVEMSFLDRGFDLRPRIVPRACGTFVLRIDPGTNNTIAWSGPGVSGPAASRDTLLVSGQSGVVIYRVRATNRSDSSCRADTILRVDFNVSPYRLPVRSLAGTCGQSLNLVAPAAPGWGSFRWQLPNGQIVSQNPYAVSSGGSYVVLAKNTQTGCESGDTLRVTFPATLPPPLLSAASPTTCAGATAPTLSATGQGVVWYADSTLTRRLASGLSFTPAPVATPGRAVFFATQTEASGCTSSPAQVAFTVAANPSLNPPRRTLESCFRDQSVWVQLDAGSGTGYTHAWRRSGTGAVLGTEQTLRVREAGAYVVEVQNAASCTARDTLLVSERCPPPVSVPQVYLPGVFTPNGDGLNDTFELKGDALQDLELTVYNRWGEAIHSLRGADLSSVQTRFWDGTIAGLPAPPGAYAYKLRVRMTLLDEAFVKLGVVRLER